MKSLAMRLAESENIRRLNKMEQTLNVVDKLNVNCAVSSAEIRRRSQRAPGTGTCLLAFPFTYL